MPFNIDAISDLINSAIIIKFHEKKPATTR